MLLRGGAVLLHLFFNKPQAKYKVVYKRKCTIEKAKKETDLIAVNPAILKNIYTNSCNIKKMYMYESNKAEIIVKKQWGSFIYIKC